MITGTLHSVYVVLGIKPRAVDRQALYQLSLVLSPRLLTFTYQLQVQILSLVIPQKTQLPHGTYTGDRRMASAPLMGHALFSVP